MKRLIYILIIIFTIVIFKNYLLLQESIIYGVNLWLNKVFPFLFIMIIINETLLNLGITNNFKKVNLYILFTSIISGTPTSQHIIGTLYKKNIISYNTACKVITYSYFSNPLFMYSFLITIFKIKTAIKLIIIHYISNIIIIFIYKDNEIIKNSNNYQFNITKIIKNAIDTNILVLGVICLYLIISNVLLNNLDINNTFKIFIKGTLEVTQGLNLLINNNLIYKKFLASLFLSFGGLSIHTQVKCVLNEYNLPYKNFLHGRLIATIISLLLTILA